MLHKNGLRKISLDNELVPPPKEDTRIVSTSTETMNPNRGNEPAPI